MRIAPSPSRTRQIAAGLLATLLASHTSTLSARSHVHLIPELLDASPAEHWQTIPDDELVLLQLHSGQVLVRLAPFASPQHTQRRRRLIQEGYFADSSVVRVQENYVVQWGQSQAATPAAHALEKLADETSFTLDQHLSARLLRLDNNDSYAAHVGFIDGFAVALSADNTRAWLTHCHGSVGTVQADPVDSDGAVYYYTATGNPARELDAKIPVVGRIIAGIDALTTLPRGQGVYSFLDDERYIPIAQTRLASQLPAGQRPQWRQLRIDSPTFTRLLELRAQTLKKTAHDDHYPVDICSVPLPVRQQPAAADS